MYRLLMVAVAALAWVGPALAADLPAAPVQRAPTAYLPPPFTWTAFYIGLNLGGASNYGNLTDSVNNVTWGVDKRTTFVGGAQVGGNYQFQSLVVGVEADFDWFANDNNSGGGFSALGTTVQGSNNGRWLTSVTGRLGWAFDHVLLYGKGGGAWVGSNNVTLVDQASGASVSFANSNTNTGWTAGGGVEWAFADNWSVKAEYDYVGLSNNSLTVPAPFTLAGDTFSTSGRNIQMITFGMNYLFH